VGRKAVYGRQGSSLWWAGRQSTVDNELMFVGGCFVVSRLTSVLSRLLRHDAEDERIGDDDDN